MAADVAQFSAAIDKVYKTISTQEVQVDPKEVKGLSDREALQYLERKFHQQLQRARSAFLQEFRNHSVVVESEVRKIREELTARMEEKYGDRIRQLKVEAVESAAVAQKHKDEVTHLRNLAGLQETYLAAVRQKWGIEGKERLTAEIARLKEELAVANRECDDLTHQLMCRDELVAQLNNELAALEGELKRQALAFTEERRAHEEYVRGLQKTMVDKQEQFQSHLKEYEERFEEYKGKTTTELHIQDILNRRRAEALRDMEEERQRHIKARTKPTHRIGPSGERELEFEAEARCEDYSLVPARYRVDDMGMDTSWRDYELNALQLAPNARKAQPKFQVERLRKAAQRGSLGPIAPVATDTPRAVLHVCDLQAGAGLPGLPPTR